MNNCIIVHGVEYCKKVVEATQHSSNFDIAAAALGIAIGVSIAWPMFSRHFE